MPDTCAVWHPFWSCDHDHIYIKFHFHNAQRFHIKFDIKLPSVVYQEKMFEHVNILYIASGQGQVTHGDTIMILVLSNIVFYL